MKKSPRTTSLEDAGSPPQIDQRRLFLRQQPRTLVYVELEGGNGGIALNISEDGFCVQAVVALMEDALPRVRFQLPGQSDWIEASAHIIWANDSRKLVGARFVDLPENSRRVIRDWLQGETQGPDVPSLTETPPAANGDTRKARPPETRVFDRAPASRPATRLDTPSGRPPVAPPSASAPEPPTVPSRTARNSSLLGSPERFTDRPPVQPARQRQGEYDPLPPPPPVSSPEPPTRPAAAPLQPARDQQRVPAMPPPPAATEPAAPPAPVPPPPLNSGEPVFAPFPSIASADRYRPPVEERSVGVSGVIVLFVFLGVACVAAGWAMGAGNFATAGIAQAIFGSGTKPSATPNDASQPAQVASSVSEIEVVPSSGNSWKIALSPASPAPPSSPKAAPQTPLAPDSAEQSAAPAPDSADSKGSSDPPALAQDEQAPGDAKQAAAATVAPSTHSPSVKLFPRYDSKPASATDPELEYRVDPIYPADAIREHVSGVVKLRLTIQPDGSVGQVFLVSGPPLLVDSAINAARRWRYVPATENNVAKESSVDIGLVFQLP